MPAVRVRVPATSANLGPGFDCLGLALELRNEFRFDASGWVTDPAEVRLTVRAEGEGVRGLPRDQDNLVFRAAATVFARAGRYPAKLDLTLQCAIPVGKGLGSSASAVVGGVWGASALLGLPADGESLAAAVGLEGHPDNVLPAVFGGLTIAMLGADGAPRHIRIPVEAPLRAVVAVPSFSLRTSEARRRLPKQVPLADAVFNLSRTAMIAAGAATGDWGSALEGMEDRLHQPFRAALIPGFSEVCQAARSAGAQAAVLSGAGPSVLALVLETASGVPAGERATKVGQAMSDAFLAAGVTSRALVLEPAREGVQVLIG